MEPFELQSRINSKLSELENELALIEVDSDNEIYKEVNNPSNCSTCSGTCRGACQHIAIGCPSYG